MTPNPPDDYPSEPGTAGSESAPTTLTAPEDLTLAWQSENGWATYPIPGVQYASVRAPVLFGDASGTRVLIDEAVDAAVYMRAQLLMAFPQQEAPATDIPQQAQRPPQQQQSRPAPAQGGQQRQQQGQRGGRQGQGGGQRGEAVKNPPAQDIVTNEGAMCPDCGWDVKESQAQYMNYEYSADGMALPQNFYCDNQQCSKRSLWRSQVVWPQ